MLAIVIPYFKINYFEETLKSLSNQTDKRFKVYIGDDNSCDNPFEIIKKHSSELTIKYEKFNTNLGSISLVKQWNRCLNLVENETWVMILGDDDVLSDNFIEEFYNNLNKFENTISVIRYATFKIDEKSNYTTKKHTNSEIENCFEFLIHKKRSSLSEYIFKKDKVLFYQFKNFPLAWFSDYLAVIEFSELGNIFSINNAHVLVRISKESISGQNHNLELKNKAKFLFYKYIFKKYYNKLTTIQLTFISENLNKCFYNYKKKTSWFVLISLSYLRKFNFLLLFVFLKGIFVNILYKIK
jgi:glycosyltransferase involved in cell wall biosynthesis